MYYGSLLVNDSVRTFSICSFSVSLVGFPHLKNKTVILFTNSSYTSLHYSSVNEACHCVHFLCAHRLPNGPNNMAHLRTVIVVVLNTGRFYLGIIRGLLFICFVLDKTASIV